METNSDRFMKEKTDYIFRDDLVVEGEKTTCPIEILTDEFNGVIFRFGKIVFPEVNDTTNNIEINYDIDFIKSTSTIDEDSLLNNSELSTQVGDIMMSILTEEFNENRNNDSSESNTKS